MVCQSLIELVGKTPLVELNNIAKVEQLQARLVAKVEFFNPGGSVKDRVALGMIRAAEADGRLKPGGTIIEPTSGNTGIGLAWIGAVMGYKTIIVMPDTMSIERQKLIKAYGAQVILTPGEQGMKGAIDKAEAINRETPNSFIPQQFSNPANPATHVGTTAEEIWQDTDGEVHAFVAGVGSAGTISGIGKGLKQHNADIKIIAVEPASSPVITEGRAAAHNIQGIGANFVPDNYDASVVDFVQTVTDADALATARRAAKEEGLLVGISSGASLWAAIQLAKQPEYAGKTIVALLPDTGERYLSTALFE
ncbi:MAG: cysteine synthase A [Bacteroidaceae bacterium]|nr:cysteine synthase A [Bacteroidaceae bacterium]